MAECVKKLTVTLPPGWEIQMQTEGENKNGFQMMKIVRNDGASAVVRIIVGPGVKGRSIKEVLDGAQKAQGTAAAITENADGSCTVTNCTSQPEGEVRCLEIFKPAGVQDKVIDVLGIWLKNDEAKYISDFQKIAASADVK